MSALWFFERLGLQPTSDIKSIKRAYAVALKLIDQQHERDAFERLRAAYEQALAWAATRADERKHEEEGDEEIEGDHDRDGDAQGADVWSAPEPGPPDRPILPVAPSFSGIPTVPLSPIPPPRDLARDVAHEAERTRNAALTEWVARLLDGGGEAAALLQQACLDPDLLHLDSQQQLEARLIDALHADPEGRVDLFEAAARRFGWHDRSANPPGSPAAARWMARVVDEGLLWDAQKSGVRQAQQAALDAIARTDSPGPAEAIRHAEALLDMENDHGHWLALRLTAARRAAWTRSYEAAQARMKRAAGAGELTPTDRRTLVRKAAIAVGIALALTTVAILWMVRHSASSGVPAVPAGQPAPAAPAASLAFEFTGPVDVDSCATAHEFVHESNWLSTPDRDAIALLLTRAILCQDNKHWPAGDDPLMTCLRAERAAALTAGQRENSSRCDTPAKPK